MVTALDLQLFAADVAVLCAVNASRVEVVGQPAVDADASTTSVTLEITVAPSAALLSASDALQRLLETANAMSVAAGGEDIMQYGAQVLQRPAGVGGSVRPPTKQPDAESPFTALLIGLIAGGSFCGLGFAVGLVALTWRYCKRRKQVKIAQH